MILLIIFLNNRETLHQNTYSCKEKNKTKHKAVCIDFLSGVCFAREGQFNESTSRVPEGETVNQRQKMFSLFHECHRLWVTGMDFSPGCDLKSQTQSFLFGRSIQRSGSFIIWIVQLGIAGTATSGGGYAMFCKRNYCSFSFGSIQDKHSKRH